MKPKLTSPEVLTGVENRKAADEMLITDARAGLTPRQMVERKLVSLSKGQSVPLSLLSPARTRPSPRLPVEGER